MAANGKQSKTTTTTIKAQKPEDKPTAAQSLVGRIGRLNELARQHNSNRGATGKTGAPAGVGTGGSKPGGGSVGAGQSAPTSSAALPVKAKKKKVKVTKSSDVMEVRAADGTHKLLPLVGGGAPKPKTREYKDKSGRTVATTQVARSAQDFSNRLKTVQAVGYHKKAVGLATSSLYHGSQPIEGDFSRDGVRGTRVAGNQYVDMVETQEGSPVEAGSRLTMQLVNPEALGAILKKQAQVYEQCKFNHFKLIYKPVVPATEEGSIAIYFKNDTQNPIYEIGLDELKAAASHQSFIETQVWSPCELAVQPSDIVKKYWDEVNGDVATEVQGLITVISTSHLGGSKTFGHLYLEYDVEFYSPSLDYEVDEIDIVHFVADWTNFNTVAGNPIRLVGTAPVAGAQTFHFDSEVLPTGEYVLYGEVYFIQDDFGLKPVWCTQADTAIHDFAVGQGFYLRFSGQTNVWNDSTMTALLYADLQSAMTVAGDNDLSDGQLMYSGSYAGRQATVWFRMKTLPLAEGEE